MDECPVDAVHRESLESMIAEQAPDALDFEAWSRMDKTVRVAGREQGPPWVKFVVIKSMMEVVQLA